MHDAGQLRLVQNPAGMQAQQHGGRGLLLLPKKTVLIGQRQVHAHIGHGGNCLNRAGQLALQPALEGQTLLELGHTKTVGLHHLETTD